MAKELRVSDDGGSTFVTLQGGTADFQLDNESIDDTVFGQAYQSNERGLISWTMSGNAYFKGFAGYKAVIKQSGSSTNAPSETFTNTTGQTYQIDDTSKRVWDRNGSFTVYDNGNPVSAGQIEEFDYLFGKVTFVGSYTVTGPITADVDYLPMTAVGKANEFTLTQTADTIDVSDFATAQSNGGYTSFDPGLRTVSLDISGIFDSSANFKTTLANRDELIVEVNPDGNSESIARGFFKAASTGQSGDVGAVEEETITFELNVPNDGITPFSWEHSNSSTIPDGAKLLLTEWLAENKIDAQYLYDGTNGYEGTVVISDVSLSSGLSAMNEFSVTLQNDGAYTSVP